MNLNNLFVKHLTEKTGLDSTATYLLAVSGGVDSMVMVHLFYRAGLTFAVAHCNFSLRAEESDLDHELVREYCRQLNIPFYDITFDTQKIIVENQSGIQETARKLRYNWFQQLCTEHGFNYIATAHHQDDNAETVLFNIIRGTGLKGLKGIPPKNGSVIRPLLFTNKESLLQYANENDIPFRNDLSNLKNNYSRNKIRNTIIPMMQEINPEATKHINNLSEYSYAVSAIVNQHIEQLSSDIIRIQNGQTIINCLSLLSNPLLTFYLYELLSDFDFNPAQIKDMQEALGQSKSGSQFLSLTHTATINRNEIIIQKTETILAQSALLERHDFQEFSIGSSTYWARIHQAETIQEYEPEILYLDADLLTFPLTVRMWENGDIFSPLGMQGKKKVSDFLIDLKVSLPDKKNTFIITSKNEIVAILPYRIDNTFKVSSKTRFVLQFVLK